MGFHEAIYSSAGVGIGLFIGCLIGLGMQKRQGRLNWLWKDSVLATSLLAGLVAWSAFAAMKMVFG